MTLKKNNWALLTKLFSPDLNEILQQQYFGSQFIAMAGRSLIKQRDDDSNTTMVFHSELQSFVGEPMPGNIQVLLNLSNLSIELLREDSSLVPPIVLPGLTMKTGFDKFSQALNSLGIITDNLKNKLHYEFPDHSLSNGSVFTYNQPDLISENIAHRHNANMILNEVIPDIKDSQSVRIWPHHFDTGSIIPLEHDSMGVLTQSAGLGWAIPDGMIDEPYFYLSIWSKDPIEFPSAMPQMKDGNWMMPGWNGAVLKLSEILSYTTATEQHEVVRSFFNSGLRIIRELI